MSRRLVLISYAAAAIAFAASVSGAQPASAPAADFARTVDLSRVRLMAVQHDGRFKTLDTLAREMIQVITGGTTFDRQVDGATIRQDALFTFLDLMFEPESYHAAPLIYVKKKPVRQELIRAAGSSIDPQEQERIRKEGRVSLAFLTQPAVLAKLDELNRDIMRTAKDVDALSDAANLADPRALRRQMRMIPPPDARSPQARWYGIDDLQSGTGSDAGMPGTNAGVPGLDETVKKELLGQWRDAEQAWRAGDAATAGAALNAMAYTLSTLNPAVYPAYGKLGLEHWYYRYKKMTWTWWFYAIAAIFLLMGIVYRWPRARATGTCWFILAFGLHTAASGIRWYLAGRIPNSNMFEAVTAAAWFGAVAAVFFELGPWLSRRAFTWRLAWAGVIGGTGAFVISLLARGVAFNDWQHWGWLPTSALIVVSAASMGLIAMVGARRFVPGGLPLLAACMISMVALMCGYFLPIDLDSNISNRMPVLNDLWLYIHTNMIILSYGLIAMAYLTAAMYVVGRLLTAPTPALWMWLWIPTLVVPLPALGDIVGRVAGWLHIPLQIEGPITLFMILPAWLPFLLVLVAYSLATVVRGLWAGSAKRAFAVWEGTPMLGAGIVSSGVRLPVTGVAPPVGSGDADGRGEGLAKVLDGATMLLMELSFITLWTGIIMGAVWADHSWGRPWGWDPKEVFALNTWIIFLILVHVRLRVKDKALWTAVLAVLGCAVMLFNWIVVNFFITGLHSYA